MSRQDQHVQQKLHKCIIRTTKAPASYSFENRKYNLGSSNPKLCARVLIFTLDTCEIKGPRPTPHPTQPHPHHTTTSPGSGNRKCCLTPWEESSQNEAV